MSRRLSGLDAPVPEYNIGSRLQTQPHFFQVFCSSNAKGNTIGIFVVTDLASAHGIHLSQHAHSHHAWCYYHVAPKNIECCWYQYGKEIQFCGHGALALAHYLFKTGTREQKFEVQTHFGSFVALPEGAAFKSITIEIPAIEDLSPINPVFLTEYLSPLPNHAFINNNYICAEYSDVETVRTCKPNGENLKRDHQFLIVTAWNDQKYCGYVQRYFTYAAGGCEDGATGSIQALLAPYWAKKTGHRRFESRQLSQDEGVIMVYSSKQCVQFSGYIE